MPWSGTGLERDLPVQPTAPTPEPPPAVNAADAAALLRMLAPHLDSKSAAIVRHAAKRIDAGAQLKRGDS